MLVMVKHTGQTNRAFNQLVDDLDNNLKIFTLTAQEFFLPAVVEPEPEPKLVEPVEQE